MTTSAEDEAAPASSRRPRIRLGRGAEFDLVRAFLGPEGPLPEAVRVGPGDDALVLEDGVVISCDLSVEDVHFRRSWLTFQEIGYRAAAAALSDLAGMAAEPLGVLVSLAISPSEAESVGTALHAGVHEALASVEGALLGGDLSASPAPLVLDVVAVGRADEPALRDGARPGDEVWVTGRLGGAAGAVRVWEGGGEPGPGLRKAFARPRPRIREARWLVREGRVRALLDLSDGLAGDAGHLAAAGGVRVVLEAAAIPVEPGLEAGAAPGEALDLALRGGEDYELLLAAAPGSVEELVDEFALRFGTPLTRVGRVEAGEGVHLARGEDGRPTPLDLGGFDHFAAGDGGR
ncbi:MAG: thiamine-phosphate kinase [Gemmatimonadetes bacterium]|nr:thiamine-phosphate kinase [Gemmatimonadota bacterium]NIR80070.1 thiamine-phosphate kinase [Gemmatimonadota bacterium]NIT88808.1 thiamine-phosphate kinase [Gemmatimonadota bacterium]NIU32612.1 thiamine-phosphate kinase [Gemmatimonadota bacterium]NIU37065.1 thiamine-phosphate kinase [Gemmatimonadota bacterium]